MSIDLLACILATLTSASSELGQSAGKFDVSHGVLQEGNLHFFLNLLWMSQITESCDLLLDEQNELVMTLIGGSHSHQGITSLSELFKVADLGLPKALYFHGQVVEPGVLCSVLCSAQKALSAHAGRFSV